MGHSRVAIVVGTAGVILGVAACGSTAHVIAAERTIDTNARALIPGAEISSQCPDDALDAVGATFICQATINDRIVPVTVTRQSDNQYSLIYGPEFGVVHAESQLNTALSARFPSAALNVACPQVPEAQTGAMFPCTITINDQIVTSIVTMNDPEGINLSYAEDGAIVDIPQLTADLAAGVTEQIGGSWTVTCPDVAARDNIFTTPLNQPFACTITGTEQTGAERTAIINVSMTDATNAQWQIVDLPAPPEDQTDNSEESTSNRDQSSTSNR